MKAARLLGPNDMRLMEVESTKLPKGWCRIKVKAVGVCGSDISSIAGKLVFTNFPVTPGHEFSGVVTEVNACSKIEVGMPVTANPIFGCGSCEACLAGEINHCSQTEVLGVIHHDGAYAEEVILPENMVFALPENVSAEEGAMMEAVNVAARALERGKVKEGSTVAVFGAGNIGLIIISLAKIFGASRVLAIDTVESRLKIAEQMGADEVITVAELDAAMDSYSSSFSVVIDGVGIESTMKQAVNMVVPGGDVVVYGVPAGTYPVPVLDAFKKDISIHTNRLYPHDMSKAIELVASGKINFKPMITHRCSLEEFPEMARKIVAKELDSVKVIVEVNE